MAGSAASCVKDVINRSPFISEMLIQEVISFSNLAQFIKPKVEQLYGGEVSSASIVMAIRRYAQDLKKQSSVKKGDRKIDYELRSLDFWSDKKSSKTVATDFERSKFCNNELNSFK